jgi:hypothetical protein
MADHVFNSTGVAISNNQAVNMLIIAGVEAILGESIEDMAWQLTPRPSKTPHRYLEGTT